MPGVTPLDLALTTFTQALGEPTDAMPPAPTDERPAGWYRWRRHPTTPGSPALMIDACPPDGPVRVRAEPETPWSPVRESWMAESLQDVQATVQRALAYLRSHGWVGPSR